ncbi:MAG: hypothetical protein WC346_14105 [Methanogenium sp.]|jgi:hypothetical protein
MTFSNYQNNIYSYDLGLGIEPDIIEYMKESHLIQSRVSPTRCYLLQQIEQGTIVSQSNDGNIPITSYVETSPNYKTVIWASGSNHPDIRPYVNEGKGMVEVYIDSVRATRVHEVEDLINDNEFSIVKRTDLNPARVELVFNEGFNVSSHSIGYKYTTLNKDINVERMKIGEASDNSHSMFGWSQYLDYSKDLFKKNHQILVRTPLTTTNLIINEEGRVMMEDNQCWMICEPYVKDWNILIIPSEESPTGEELRYIIENKQDSMVQGSLVSQRFKIKQLEKTDDRYKIPYITEESSITTSEAASYNVLEKEFTHLDTSLLIGNFGKDNISIFKVVILLNSFTTGNISIGSLDTPSLLVNNVDLTQGSYSYDMFMTLSSNFDVYLTLTNPSLQGTGKVIIYYL